MPIPDDIYDTSGKFLIILKSKEPMDVNSFSMKQLCYVQRSKNGNISTPMRQK